MRGVQPGGPPACFALTGHWLINTRVRREEVPHYLGHATRRREDERRLPMRVRPARIGLRDEQRVDCVAVAIPRRQRQRGPHRAPLELIGHGAAQLVHVGARSGKHLDHVRVPILGGDA